MVRNKFILSLFIIFTLLVIVKPSYGCGITFKATDDAYYRNGNSIIDNRRLISSSNKTEENVTLVKFNVSKVKESTAQEVVSVKLRLYVDSSSKSPKINAYYEANDNWTEENSNKVKYKTTYKITDNHGVASKIYTDTKKKISWIEWDLTSLNLAEFKNSDNIITIALDDVSKICLNSKMTFFSKEYCCVYAPQLIVETRKISGPTPVTPEPSSLILGMMSIGGLLGLKRKKQ